MSVIPSGSNSLVQIKPDKLTAPTQANPGSTIPPKEAVTPITPSLPPVKAGEELPSNSIILPTPADQSKDSDPIEPQIEIAVDKLNGFMAEMKRDLEFSFDKDSNRTVVTVRDATTQEVVRQLPSEAALKLAKVLQDTRSLDSGSLGQLLDVKT